MLKYGFLYIWRFSINFCRLLVGFRFKLFSTTLKLVRSEVLWGFEKNWTPIQLCLVYVVAKSCSESKFCYVELMYKKWLFATNISSAECRGKSAKQHKQTVLAFWSFTEPETKFRTTKFKNYWNPYLNILTQAYTYEFNNSTTKLRTCILKNACT